MTRAAAVLMVLAGAAAAQAQSVSRDIPYAPAPAHARQVLDVHAPAGAKHLPVVYWIHGGGWQTGDKGQVARKPQAFNAAGLVFVSINHRLWPSVAMSDIFSDVAKGLKWVHDHVAEYGGDPARVLVMGHSSGGQLAAILCSDQRLLDAEGLSRSMIKGCVPVDADTFDIPAIIEVAEVRARAHGFPLPTSGHRQKFGNDPVKHRDYSAVTHVAAGTGLPPFLIMHVAGHPDTTAQAQRFRAVLEAAHVPVTVYAAPESTHRQINDAIGTPGDPGTDAVMTFVKRALDTP